MTPSPRTVGVEQLHRQHPGIKPLLDAGIFDLSREQNFGEIKLIHQIQKEIHLLALYQTITRRGRQQGGLIRLPGAERLGLLHAPFSQADPVLSRRSGRNQENVWSAARGSMRDRLLDHLWRLRGRSTGWEDMDQVDRKETPLPQNSGGEAVANGQEQGGVPANLQR